MKSGPTLNISDLFTPSTINFYSGTNSVSVTLNPLKVNFNPMVGVATEAGMPIVVSNPASVEAKAFAALAVRVLEETN